MFIRKIMRSKLASYIKINDIDSLKNLVELEYIRDKAKTDEDEM